MSCNKIPVTLALIVALTAGLMSSAWAAERFKTLHKFKSASAGGAEPSAGLLSTQQAISSARQSLAVVVSARCSS